MNTVFILLAFLCAIIGIVGAIVPGLPGPPISWVALLMVHLSSATDYSPAFLVIMAVLAVIITILDYVVPVWGTKQFGGSKAGASLLGLVYDTVRAHLIFNDRIHG